MPFYSQTTTAFWHGTTVLVPAQRGRHRPQTLGSHSRARLPTDAVGFVNLTFDGVNAGSEIRAYLNSTGAELFGTESCSDDHVFSGVPYYGPGQVVTIRVVANTWKIKEFTYTVPAASASIPIQQEADNWYSNP